MMLWRKAITYQFAKISRKEVQESNYDQLINKIVTEYAQNQLKIPTGLSLLEVHHLFKVFKPGDWVLDIGAGPHWSWTELALRLTKNSQKSNLVISNDLIKSPIQRPNNIEVRGDFFDEAVKTKIAMNLLKKPLDTIIINATPQYSGNYQVDGMNIMKYYRDALYFSQKYLKKGGTIVLKTLQCNEAVDYEQKSSYIFSEIYKHKPSNIPITYYTQFYVMKGYKMSSKYDISLKFLKQYQQAPSRKKPEIIQKYNKNFDWDPIKLVNNQAKIRIQQLKSRGHKNSQIIRIYEKQPYIKVQQILKCYDIIHDQKAETTSKIKAHEILKYGKSMTDPKLLPENIDEFKQTILYYAQKMKKEEDTKNMKQQPQKKKAPGKKPLRDDEVYMKENKIEEEKTVYDELVGNYKQIDLLGYTPEQKPNQQEDQQGIEAELQKLISTLPQEEREQNNQENEFLGDKSEEQYKTRADAAKEYKNRTKYEYAEGEKQLMQFLESQVKKNKRKEDTRFDFAEQQAKDAFVEGDRYTREEERRLFMDSKPEKKERFVNQRRSKRKNKMNKF